MDAGKGGSVHTGLPNTTEEEDNVTINTTPTLLIDSDPMRQELVIMNDGANDIYLGLTAQVSVGNGIRVGSNGGQVVLQRFYDHSLTGRRLYAIAETAAVSVYTLAVREYREG